MPRAARGVIAEAYVHVTARGNARRDLFADEADFAQFLLYLGRTVARCEWRCASYCLMTNHYHLVLEVREPTLPQGMGWLNGSYAQYVNARHGRDGHVFGERYSAVEIDTEEHLASACRYVDLNPVRAGLCAHPREWPWSSYRALVGEVPALAFLDVGLARSFDFDYESFVAHALLEWKSGTVPLGQSLERSGMPKAGQSRWDSP